MQPAAETTVSRRAAVVADAPAGPDLDLLAAKLPLARWLDANIPQLGLGPLETAIVSGGTSNVIVALNRGGQTMMLRRPPAVPPPGSEKSILREARVLTALNGTPVPHPHCFGSCADPSVIGAPFYVMEKVEGWAAELRGDRILNSPPFDKMPYHYGVAFARVDGLVSLANVDYKALGLTDFGRIEGYLERQVDRWEGQIRSYAELYGHAFRDLPGFIYTRDWLRANVPSDFKAGIIHGDVGTPNALFSFDVPVRLTAMIDWELSTIGDPLIDLAWFTNKLRDEECPDVLPENALYASEMFPTWQEVARYYAAGTGRNISNFAYYRALALFKGACIVEYKVAQSAAGILPPETGRFFDKLVRGSFARAEIICRKAG